MKTLRIVHEGLSDCRVRASGMLFQDAGGCWHAHVPMLGLTGYGLSRQAAYASLEMVVRTYLRTVWGDGGWVDELAGEGWRMEDGEWTAALVPYGQLRRVLAYMRKGAVMRPFGLLVEVGRR